MRYLRLINIFLLFTLLSTSCAKKNYVNVNHYKPLLHTSINKTEKYNLSFVFRGNTTSGTLISKKMEDGEVRIIAVTLFGLSLFDFGLTKEKMCIYNCIEPLNKKKVLKLLENDFRLLFTDDDRIRKIAKIENKLKFATNNFLARTVITAFPADSLDRVKIVHPMIGLTINLELIKDGDIK